METDILVRVIVLAVLLIMSAFFSSAETALTTVNKMRIRALCEEKHKGAVRVQKLTDNSTKMLSAILIGNNIVNLTASSLTTSLALKAFDENYAVAVATFILTFIVIEFGEITPKTLATIHSEKLSLFAAPVILLLTYVFTPIIIFVNAISRIILAIFGVNTKDTKEQMTENELMTILDVSHEDGVIEAEEHEIISNVVSFGDSDARDVMIPRIDMTAVPDDISYDELKSIFEDTMYTRLPVYHETIDNVIGIISMKDVFFHKGTKKAFDIHDYLREPYFTYESKKTSELLKELRLSANSIAIVLDEYGSTAGLLTMEDLLEEIIGEIRDEYDSDEVDDIIETGDNEYEIEGNTKLDEINSKFDVNICSDDYESVAGHIIHILGRLAKVDDECEDEEFQYHVLEMEKMRISKVRLSRKIKEDEGNFEVAD